ncbi:hypothetical protein HNQ02_002885 [Flavobacterium sp. 7E]|uniref:anti-sigma factor n=1 Tax=unclassified Flavobacterium TaxID=196869 RepID=UPI00157000D9|nr:MULTISPECIES: anti-sigma factor [unclassified Flavobacterium]MBE0391238.1 hypothetical protein [Flavobacterium sp. PL002]NRS89950.1 hypothetical protein [Flavobacterium sp. 7E]NRT16773.1 hypothetical protein [Flavobacterium sp. 28A]
MKKTTLLSLVSVLSLGLFASCNNDDNPANTSKDLKLNISGLEDLGANYKYEGWIIANGQPVSTGVFTVSSDGTMSKTSFTVASADLDIATKFILTIEPFPDTDPAPAKTHLLAGDFSSNSATLTIGAPEALGNDFLSAKGSYVLATPSDDDDTNEKSGLWFLGTLPPTAGLELPTLPEGWKYEGWAVIDGVPVTTGTFTSVSGVDDFSGFSGALGTPPFPGEDFLVNAPTGVTFPTDLSGKTAVISIEPFPDNSTKPFLLKPLVGSIPAAALDHTVYTMSNNAKASAATGTATK